jgi:hypothetical protein
MRFGSGVALSVAALAAASPASATGMHGHIWSSHCALETVTDARLKPLLETHRVRLDNGSFFPDSGYAAKHEYGETAHWEKFVDGYIKWLRAKHADPVRDAPQHVAFLMGAASHGLVDQTFDILYMDKVREVDGPTDDLDTSMDIFLAARRKFVPDLAYDANELVDVFGKNVALTVPASEIKEGMDLARVGMGFVAEILWKDDAKRSAQYPWAKANYQDPRVPGSYPWGALAVAKYWENILRRLDGDSSAEALVVATDPPHAVTAGKMDAFVTAFVGYGVKRPSITASSFFVIDAAGSVIPTEIRIRGDEYATTLQLKPKGDWAEGAPYKLVLDTAIETVDGTHPSKRIEVPFVVTPIVNGAPSPCPLALAAYPRPSDTDEEPAPTPNEPKSESSGGCATSGSTGGSAALAIGALALTLARRARGKR